MPTIRHWWIHCRRVAEINPRRGVFTLAACRRRPHPFVSISGANSPKSKMWWPSRSRPSNRYQTLDVIRAVAESERPIALYTGNDDHIVMDLVTTICFPDKGKEKRAPHRRRTAGPLGSLDAEGGRIAPRLPCGRKQCGEHFPPDLVRRAVEVTDSNAAFFRRGKSFCRLHCRTA